MNFSTAISTCLYKYATFKGRASRSEFWWFYLFVTLLSWGASVAGALSGDKSSLGGLLVSLAFIIPTFSAGCRRLHDVGRSGWWQLLYLTVIGSILVIVWKACKSEEKANGYGAYTPARL